ncbi:unnamed protein product [Amaranthus hypochondriacus]
MVQEAYIFDVKVLDRRNAFGIAFDIDGVLLRGNSPLEVLFKLLESYTRPLEVYENGVLRSRSKEFPKLLTFTSWNVIIVHRGTWQRHLIRDS